MPRFLVVPTLSDRLRKTGLFSITRNGVTSSTSRLFELLALRQHKPSSPCLSKKTDTNVANSGASKAGVGGNVNRVNIQCTGGETQNEVGSAGPSIAGSF